MITNALISFGLTIVEFMVSVLPDSDGFPSEVHASMEQVGGYIGILDPIVPITTLATLVGLTITFELSVFAFKGIRWAVSHLPMIGGRG